MFTEIRNALICRRDETRKTMELSKMWLKLNGVAGYWDEEDNTFVLGCKSKAHRQMGNDVVRLNKAISFLYKKVNHSQPIKWDEEDDYW